MIEGKTPICDVLVKYTHASKFSTIKMLTRVQKLYSAKEEVLKILKLVFKVFHSANEDHLLLG